MERVIECRTPDCTTPVKRFGSMCTRCHRIAAVERKKGQPCKVPDCDRKVHGASNYCRLHMNANNPDRVLAPWQVWVTVECSASPTCTHTQVVIADKDATELPTYICHAHYCRMRNWGEYFPDIELGEFVGASRTLPEQRALKRALALGLKETR